MDKKTSQKKTEANRRNAGNSTGPKSAKGKRRVSKNALKHGILSKEVVIQEGEGKESVDEFNALYTKLWEDRQPQGKLEELLVERIAVSYWRLKRTLRAEAGEIRKSQDSIYILRLLEHIAQDNTTDTLEPREEFKQLDRTYMASKNYLTLIVREREKLRKANEKPGTDFGDILQGIDIVRGLNVLYFPDHQVLDLEEKVAQATGGDKRAKDEILEFFDERMMKE